MLGRELRSWGYLKPLHSRELRSYPQVSKHISALNNLFGNFCLAQLHIDKDIWFTQPFPTWRVVSRPISLSTCAAKWVVLWCWFPQNLGEDLDPIWFMSSLKIGKKPPAGDVVFVPFSMSIWMLQKKESPNKTIYFLCINYIVHMNPTHFFSIFCWLGGVATPFPWGRSPDGSPGCHLRRRGGAETRRRGAGQGGHRNRRRRRACLRRGVASGEERWRGEENSYSTRLGRRTNSLVMMGGVFFHFNLDWLGEIWSVQLFNRCYWPDSSKMKVTLRYKARMIMPDIILKYPRYPKNSKNTIWIETSEHHGPVIFCCTLSSTLCSGGGICQEALSPPSRRVSKSDGGESEANHFQHWLSVQILETPPKVTSTQQPPLYIIICLRWKMHSRFLARWIINSQGVDFPRITEICQRVADRPDEVSTAFWDWRNGFLILIHSGNLT